jgi:hypothetical protein
MVVVKAMDWQDEEICMVGKWSTSLVRQQGMRRGAEAPLFHGWARFSIVRVWCGDAG